MPNLKTTDEARATTLTGAEPVRLVQGGSSKQTTSGEIGHQFRGARAYMTSDDTTVNSVATAYTLSFDAADLDTDTFWDGGAPTRLTVPTGLGITVVEASARVRVNLGTADTGATLTLQHLNSASTVLGLWAGSGEQSGTTVRFLNVTSGPVPVSDGDYFIALYQEETDTSVTIVSAFKQTNIGLTVLGMVPV